MKSVTEAGVYAQDPFNSNIRYFEMDIVLLQKSRAAEFNSNIRYFEMQKVASLEAYKPMFNSNIRYFEI